MNVSFLIDFDDTIVRTYRLHEVAFKRALEYLQVNVSFDYNRYRGLSTRDAMALILPDSKDLTKATHLKQSIYRTIIEESAPRVHNGFRVFISTLGKKRIPWGIVSGASKNSLDAILSKKKIFPTLGIIHSNSFKNGKPSSEPYDAAIQEWGLNPRECIAIEDSVSGITSALSAGIACFSIHSFQDPSATRHFNSWFEVAEFVRREF